MAFLLSHAGCRKPNCATAACNVACVFIGKSKIMVFRALFHVEGESIRKFYGMHALLKDL